MTWQNCANDGGRIYHKNVSGEVTLTYIFNILSKGYIQFQHEMQIQTRLKNLELFDFFNIGNNLIVVWSRFILTLSWIYAFYSSDSTKVQQA
jgi:hypothetical protein